MRLLVASCMIYGLVNLVSANTQSSTSSIEITPEQSTTSTKPTFIPLTDVGAIFWEQFTDDWQTRWQPSHAKKESTSADGEESAYVGEWSVEEPKVFPGIVGDKGLVVKNKAAHHAISAKFPTKLDNKDKTLVIQYEVKPQDGLECGGAYLKLLRENEALHAEEFSNTSPYVIMFGPDKCGATNKVHFIFQHKNSKTGTYEEKHLVSPPSAKTIKTTTLYTLIVSPDQLYEIRIDGEKIKNGSLLQDFSPPVNPLKEIDDSSDQKPADWIDDAKISDPAATRPDEWDEEAPYEIVDVDAVRPSDWLDKEPLTVDDPSAEKPEAWDDDEDGDWSAPQIANPKCEAASGCGPWTPPMKRNLAYKGKWTPPMIENPSYRGPWSPRKIPNPEYFEDSAPANFEPIGAIGFEIWTMQKDILFDNIYIGHSVEDAQRIRRETFDIKKAAEKREQDASLPLEDDVKSPMDLSFTKDPYRYVKERTELFVDLFKRDPVQAMKFMPEIAGGMTALVMTAVALLFGLISMSSTGSAAPPSAVTVSGDNHPPVVDDSDSSKSSAQIPSDGVDAPVARRSPRKAQ